MNLTFGREKKVKDLEGDEDRAAPVPEQEGGEGKGDKENNGIQGKSTKTVYPTGKTEASTPKRTDYSEKGNSSQEEKKKSKKAKSKSNYKKETKAKENKRKGPLVPKVEESQSRENTYRKVPKKL